MGAKRKQINVRIDEDTDALLPVLCVAMSEAMGVKIQNSDLFRLGVRKLKEQYLPDWIPPSAQAGPKRKKPKADSEKRD